MNPPTAKPMAAIEPKPISKYLSARERPLCTTTRRNWRVPFGVPRGWSGAFAGKLPVEGPAGAVGTILIPGGGVAARPVFGSGGRKTPLPPAPAFSGARRRGFNLKRAPSLSLEGELKRVGTSAAGCG